MRRVLVFWAWEATQWEIRGAVTGFADNSPEAVEGRKAYAMRQATIRRQMVRYCQSAWRDVPQYVSLGVED